MDEITAFLEKLIQFGMLEGLKISDKLEPYFRIDTIGLISKTCCTLANTKVIDFDRTKMLIAKQYQLSEPKSCDALKIIIEGDASIDFIEFKGLKKFIYNLWRDGKPIDIQMESQFDKFKLNYKIEDSLLILRLMIQNRKFNLTTDERLIYSKLPKNYIILTDLELEEDGRLDLFVNLNLLAANNPKNLEKEMSEILQQKIDIAGSKFPEINRPILLTCSTIDKYYKNREQTK